MWNIEENKEIFFGINKKLNVRKKCQEKLKNLRKNFKGINTLGNIIKSFKNTTKII